MTTCQKRTKNKRSSRSCSSTARRLKSSRNARGVHPVFRFEGALVPAMGTVEPTGEDGTALPVRMGKQLLPVAASSTPMRIASIQFGVMDAAEITRSSHIEVNNSQIYERADRSAMRGGALDPRLGAIDKDAVCETCHQKIQSCVGHFGYVRLILPVFHSGYFRSTVQFLQMICKTCARVLLSGDARERYVALLRNPRISSKSHIRGALLREIWEKSKKVRVCPHCGAANGDVKKTAVLKIVHYPDGNKPPSKRKEEDEMDDVDDDDPNDVSSRYDSIFRTALRASADLKKHIDKAADDLHPLRVLNLFERVPAEDVQLLDMNPEFGRPERLILQHLPVPPLCTRPTVCSDPSVGSTEDDLTIKAAEIAEINNVIRGDMEKGLSTPRVFDMWDHLQYEVARYINSEHPGLPSLPPPSKPIRGMSQRLKGKTGRFRGNLSGKRVDFSARTVISPDPNLAIDQVGVPVYVARILTFPQHVTAFNIEMLREAVVNGPDVHPGANFVKYPDGLTKYLRYGDRKQLAAGLVPGVVVERHLVDGDVVLFNRQPSLHRISIMAHHVKVGNHRTFRFNECACSPYNADFDGDEMNLHVPQTEEARAEALELMSVLRNLITPRNGEPLVAAIQDFITASYLVTRKDVFMDRAEFFRLMCTISNAVEELHIPPPCILKPLELWSGKQVFTALIQNAALLQGTLEGKDAESSEDERKFLSALTTAVEEKGYSLQGKTSVAMVPQMCPRDGYVYFRGGELVSGQLGKKSLGSGSKMSILYILQREYGCDAVAYAMNRLARFTARWLADAGFSIGVDDVSPSLSLRNEKERLVREGYRQCEEYIEQLRTKKLDLRPGCTPEETLEAVMNKTLGNIREEAGKACLAEIDPNTNAALTMALCGSKGSSLNISQMVSCVGQQTVSGNRAPDGFFGRALPHFELGLNAKSPVAKGFVSNSFFSGMTPTEFFFHTMGGREGLVDTAVKTAETGYMQRRLMKALEDLSIQYDSTVRSSNGTVIQMRYGDDGLDPSEMESSSGRPVNFAQVLDAVTFALPLSDEPMLSAKELRRCAKKLLKYARRKLAVDEVVPNFGMQFILKEVHEFLFGVADTLQKERRDSGLQAQHIGEFLRRVLWKVAKATVEPGSAVGAVGAQSIGEPGTQMTLKTFHFAGVASMNITQGVPRLKEIINASKKIATPIITAELVSDKDVKVARIVKGRVERTFLGEIAMYIKEVYRAGSSYIAVKLDVETMQKLQLDTDLQEVAMRIAEQKYTKLRVMAEDITLIRPDKLRIKARPRGDAGKLLDPAERRRNREARKKETANRPFYLLQSLKLQLPSVAVQGVVSVGRAVINDKGKDGAENHKGYNLLVESDDLTHVMTIAGVDGVRVTSNHVVAVEKTLGIEAARATIMSEIKSTMESHGMTIDERHVKLLADCMTSTGSVLGITRFGISKMRTSTLMLASFEMTVDHLFHAAIHSKRDDIIGVSERIIMGVPIPLGTGLFQMLRKSTPETAQGALPARRILLRDSLPRRVNI